MKRQFQFVSLIAVVSGGSDCVVVVVVRLVVFVRGVRVRRAVVVLVFLILL